MQALACCAAPPRPVPDPGVGRLYFSAIRSCTSLPCTLFDAPACGSDHRHGHTGKDRAGRGNSRPALPGEPSNVMYVLYVPTCTRKAHPSNLGRSPNLRHLLPKAGAIINNPGSTGSRSPDTKLPVFFFFFPLPQQIGQPSSASAPIAQLVPDPRSESSI